MANKPCVLIVEARFYDDIADALVKGATTVLEDAECDFERIAVPGVFEVPAAVSMAYASTVDDSGLAKYDGVISLGCVIRGETDHYDHICREVSRGLMDMSIDLMMPHGFGILTCENRDQAWVRADTAQRNVGGRAAEACLRMIEIRSSHAFADISA